LQRQQGATQHINKIKPAITLNTIITVVLRLLTIVKPEAKSSTADVAVFTVEETVPTVPFN